MEFELTGYNDATRLPRHSINLVTGTGAALYLCCCVWTCPSHQLMRWLVALVALTSALFHGSHTLGYREFAVRVAMKLDIAAVGLCGTYLLVIMPAECRPYCQRLMLLCACTWLATFSWGGRGLATSWPYNPTQSLIHAVGIAVHTRAAEALCALPARAGQPPGVEGSGIVS